MSAGALRPSDLLAQFKQTEAKTSAQIRAAELLDNTVELIREMVYTHTMVQPDHQGTDATHLIYSSHRGPFSFYILIYVVNEVTESSHCTRYKYTI